MLTNKTFVEKLVSEINNHSKEFDELLDELKQIPNDENLFRACLDFVNEMPKQQQATLLFWLFKRECERSQKQFAE